MDDKQMFTRSFLVMAVIFAWLLGGALGWAIAERYWRVMAEEKLAPLTQNLDRGTFTSRCGTPSVLQLAGGVVSFAGRLMHEGDFNRLVAHHGPNSVKYYYRLPTDTTQGTLVFEPPKCPLYREQFIY